MQITDRKELIEGKTKTVEQSINQKDIKPIGIYELNPKKS